MLSNCPAPFPDELLYSLIARYRWLQKSDSHKWIIRRLFATKHALAVVDLPARLQSLHESGHLWAGWNNSKTLQRHTLFPLYTPFIPAERVVRLEQDLLGSNGGSVHLRAGIMASKVRLPFQLRFCPCCSAEERQRTGEAYWHRLHQAPGVLVCPEHQVFLEASSVETQMRRTRQAFIPAEEVLPKSSPTGIDKSRAEHEVLVRIAAGASFLLNISDPGNSLSSLRMRYLVAAAKRGYVTATGNIRWKLLLPEFDSRFSTEFLARLQVPLTGRNSDHWLARILRNPRAVQAPIRHLVLMEFLGLTAKSFYEMEIPLSPHGDGPWSCENPCCPDFAKSKIRQIQSEFSSYHREVVGILTCAACGQVTCQTKHNEWVRDRGPLWKFELERLWRDSRISLRQVARQLRVDSLTVKRQAAQLELPFPRKSKRTSGKNGPPKVGKHKGHPRHDLRQRQAQWLNLCSENQLLSTKNLRRLAPACYASLYRGCREWLKTHCPSPIRPVRAIARVDWHARDLELSQRVDRARKELLLESGPPRRISVAALGRQLRALAWIQKHSAKLPLTRAKLLNAQESAMDFARRRNFGTLPLEFEGSPAATSP